MKSPDHNLLICIWKIEYWWRQIILKSSLKRIFLYCWNFIALNNLTSCTDWDKATVKFAARSDDILIYALQKRKQYSLVYSLSWRKKGFRPLGLRFRPVGLRFRPVGLRFRPVGLRFRLQGLRSSVFVFGSSFSTHPENRWFSSSCFPFQLRLDP